MTRRDWLCALGGAAILIRPAPAESATLLRAGNMVSLRCLGKAAGRARYLDGRTGDGSVALAPELTAKFSGTKWKVRSAGESIVVLECQGTAPGAKFLDGRTAEGTVGLAPHTREPFSGTRWQVVALDDANPNIVALKCLGAVKGPKRWLDGNTGAGTVALAPSTEAPFTGTRWEVKLYPVRLADPEGKPARD